MKVTRKITVDKRECAVLDKFFEMCDEDLTLNNEDIGDLLRAVYEDCRDFEVGDELYDIEYTD